MNPNNDNIEAPKHKTLHDLLYGIIAGVTCTLIYNPLDKAIQLAQLNKTPLFVPGNFSNPYQGAVQASMQRMIFGTAYYWIQGYFRSEVAPTLRNDYHCSATSVYLITGLAAGSLHGLASNPTSLIKAQTWLDQSNTFTNRFGAFYQANGAAALLRGSVANMLSSGLYGGLYEVTRHSFRHAFKHQLSDTSHLPLMHTGVHFGCDLTAAFICTAMVSPFTYARNIQYAVSPNMPSKSLIDVTQEIHHELKSQPGRMINKLGFFAARVKMAQMAARTALNMATGQIIVDSLRSRKQ